MSKYDALWKYIESSALPSLTLTFKEISEIAEVETDHSFLNCKKELESFGYKVKKIFLKEKKIIFERL